MYKDILFFIKYKFFYYQKKDQASSLRGGQSPTWQSLKYFILKEIATVATLFRNDGFAVFLKYNLSIGQRPQDDKHRRMTRCLSHDNHISHEMRAFVFVYFRALKIF